MEELEYFIIDKNFEILSRHTGHIRQYGKSAGIEMNPYFLVRDETHENEKEFYVMYCNPSSYTFFSIEDFDKIIFREDGTRETWSFHPATGYVFCSTTKPFEIEKRTRIYLHQLVMNHYGNGKGQDSVDHINQNKLDNRRCNLRITNQSEQNRNRGKVSRHINAKPLPNDFIEWLKSTRDLDNLPKFCEYYLNTKEKKEFFVINMHHPLLKEKGNYFKISSSSGTSGNYSIIDKYLQIERGLLFLEQKKDEQIDNWTIEELRNFMNPNR